MVTAKLILATSAGSLVESDDDDLVVALALAGQIVALVDDRAVGAREVVEEDEIGIGADLAVLAEHEDAGVEIEGAAVGDARVPAQADPDRAQPRRLLAEADIAALAE